GQFFIHNSTIAILDVGNLAAESLEVNGVTASCSEPVGMDGIRISGPVHLDQSIFRCGVSMQAARIGAELSLRGVYLGRFDFTGSRTEGDLEIGPGKAGRDPGESLVKPVQDTEPLMFPKSLEWEPKTGSIILNHASVNAVKIAFNLW